MVVAGESIAEYLEAEPNVATAIAQATDEAVQKFYAGSTLEPNYHSDSALGLAIVVARADPDYSVNPAEYNFLGAQPRAVDRASFVFHNHCQKVEVLHAGDYRPLPGSDAQNEALTRACNMLYANPVNALAKAALVQRSGELTSAIWGRLARDALVPGELPEAGAKYLAGHATVVSTEGLRSVDNHIVSSAFALGSYLAMDEGIEGRISQHDIKGLAGLMGEAIMQDSTLARDALSKHYGMNGFSCQRGNDVIRYVIGQIETFALMGAAVIEEHSADEVEER